MQAASSKGSRRVPELTNEWNICVWLYNLSHAAILNSSRLVCTGPAVSCRATHTLFFCLCLSVSLSLCLSVSLSLCLSVSLSLCLSVSLSLCLSVSLSLCLSVSLSLSLSLSRAHFLGLGPRVSWGLGPMQIRARRTQSHACTRDARIWRNRLSSAIFIPELALFRWQSGIAIQHDKLGPREENMLISPVSVRLHMLQVGWERPSITGVWSCFLAFKQNLPHHLCMTPTLIVCIAE